VLAWISRGDAKNSVIADTETYSAIAGVFVCFYFIFVFDFLDSGPKVTLW